MAPFLYLKARDSCWIFFALLSLCFYLFCFLFHFYGDSWTHLVNPGQSPFLKVHWRAMWIPSAMLLAFCNVTLHIQRFWGLGHGISLGVHSWFCLLHLLLVVMIIWIKKTLKKSYLAFTSLIWGYSPKHNPLYMEMKIIAFCLIKFAIICRTIGIVAPLGHILIIRPLYICKRVWLNISIHQRFWKICFSLQWYLNLDSDPSHLKYSEKDNLAVLL